MSNNDDSPKDIREVLKAWIKPKLRSVIQREAAATATGLSPRSIESMVYTGRGGIAAWQKLVMYCLNISHQQWDSMLLEISEVLRSKSKMTKGQQAWATVGEQLSDEKRLYYAEVVLALESIRADFGSRRKPQS